MAGADAGALKKELDEARAAIRKDHDAGMGGIEVARKLCQAVDDAIVKLFDSGHADFTGSVVALGGYGRGALNPHSDVDLLFLMKEPAHLKENHPPKTMLGALWDLGLKVGHASRTIKDAMAIGKTDNESRTAMMESRFLAGSRELYADFHNRYRWEIIRRKSDAFVQSKIEELNKRRAQYGRVIRLTEPNIKNSPGGLRDLQSAIWMIRAREQAETLEDLAALGLIRQDEALQIGEAYSFLMRLRNGLHFAAGSPFDKMAHELQPRIAEGEGFTGPENVRSAALMKKYYQAAQVIWDFSRELVSLAEGYGGFGKAIGFRFPKADKLTFFADRGILRAKVFPPPDMDRFSLDDLLTLLNRTASEDLYPSRKVFLGLAWIRDNAPEDWFTGPRAGEFLLSVLKHQKSERALRVLLRAGILEKMIPEFSAIADLCQFDRYHRYSVDEHTISAVRSLEEIPESPWISQELRSLYRQSENLPVVKLALLMHDMAKRAEDHHAEDDCSFVHPILARLGLERLYDPVFFLVKQHLAMSRTAQRLNIRDQATLKMFCDTAVNRENLKLLYLLTHSDISGVGPDIWTEWKDKLLLDLYELAVKYMIEGDAVFVSGPEQALALARKTAELSGRFSAGEVARFLGGAPEKYLQTATPESVAAHMALTERAGGSRLAMEFRTNAGDKTGEFTVAFPERAGALSILSGAFAAKDIDIVEMIAHTFSQGVALDVIIARGAILPYSDKEAAANFERELNGLMDGTRSVAEMIKRRARYIKDSGAASDIEPRVAILNNISERNTVVEIMAPDRLGLLHDVSSAMAGMGLNIESAKIVTRGKRAVNVFYVTQAGGQKVGEGEPERLVAEALLGALSGGSAPKS